MIINAFIVDSSKVDNTNNVVAPYGEISTEARSYSRDIKEYSNGGVLSAVVLKVEATTTNNAIDPDTIYKMLEVHTGVTGLTSNPITPASVISYMTTLGVTAAVVSTPAHTPADGKTDLPETSFRR